MLTPHAVDIAVTISSLIASLCFTFAESFDDICALVSGNTNKNLRPKDRPTHRPSEWIRAHSLNSYFAFCKIVVKTTKNCCTERIHGTEYYVDNKLKMYNEFLTVMYWFLFLYHPISETALASESQKKNICCKKNQFFVILRLESNLEI